jgi:hypothetical protein
MAHLVNPRWGYGASFHPRAEPLLVLLEDNIAPTLTGNAERRRRARFAAPQARRAAGGHSPGTTLESKFGLAFQAVSAGRPGRVLTRVITRTPRERI